MNTGRSSFRTCGMTAALIGGIRAVEWGIEFHQLHYQEMVVMS